MKYVNKKRRIRKKRKNLREVCLFCLKKVSENSIHPFNLTLLKKFLNEKAMIKNRFKNSVCYKHQRKVKRVVCISRRLHILPYIIY